MKVYDVLDTLDGNTCVAIGYYNPLTGDEEVIYKSWESIGLPAEIGNAKANYIAIRTCFIPNGVPCLYIEFINGD